MRWWPAQSQSGEGHGWKSVAAVGCCHWSNEVAYHGAHPIPTRLLRVHESVCGTKRTARATLGATGKKAGPRRIDIRAFGTKQTSNVGANVRFRRNSGIARPKRISPCGVLPVGIDTRG